jgi:quercetin dioxygenase-like cupin family protein
MMSGRFTGPKAYAFAGTAMEVLVGGRETGGRFTVLLVTKPEGSSTPPHSHDAETELVYPLLGRVGVETEGRILAYAPGELAILPPGRPHRLFNDSGSMAREFLVCAPAIFDGFVAMAGTEIAPGSAPVPMTAADRQRLIETAPRFGVRLLHSALPDDGPRDIASAASEAIDVLGMRVNIIARLGTGEGDLVLLDTVIRPGESVPLHSHADPECFCVIDGTLELYRDGRAWTALQAEQAAYVAPNVRHAIRNGGNVPAHILMVTTTHMAGFFAAIGSPAAGNRSHAADAVEVAAFHRRVAEYGYWFASPEENEAIGL